MREVLDEESYLGKVSPDLYTKLLCDKNHNGNIFFLSFQKRLSRTFIGFVRLEFTAISFILNSSKRVRSNSDSASTTLRNELSLPELPQEDAVPSKAGNMVLLGKASDIADTVAGVFADWDSWLKSLAIV